MPESMTGFAAATVSAEGVEARVELRSVNHRHLDLRVKLPAELASLQGALTKIVRAQVDRGHVDLRVNVSRDERAEPEVRVDHLLAAAWQKALQDVSDTLALGETPTLQLIVDQPGVLAISRPENDLPLVSPVIVTAVEEATAELVASRLAEGEALAVDLRARLANLQTLHEELEALAETVVTAQRARLHQRVSKALTAAGHELDPGRLAQEVVMLSDKSDVTEELVRLRGHLHAARTTLETQRPGKRLGFLAQEILREFNTIGSKSGALEITERVVSAKVEIEKVREQVLNLA